MDNHNNIKIDTMEKYRDILRKHYIVIPNNIVKENAKENTKKFIFPFEIYPHDLSETTTFNQAQEYIRNMNHRPGGHWRLPTKEELLFMYQYKDIIGGFKTFSAETASPDFYWASTPYPNGGDDALGVRLSDGYMDWFCKDILCLSVRLVRDRID